MSDRSPDSHAKLQESCVKAIELGACTAIYASPVTSWYSRLLEPPRSSYTARPRSLRGILVVAPAGLLALHRLLFLAFEKSKNILIGVLAPSFEGLQLSQHTSFAGHTLTPDFTIFRSLTVAVV